jgi:Co/Zn/Cd efflux system component
VNSGFGLVNICHSITLSDDMPLSHARASEKQEGARSTAYTGIALNLVLMAARIVVGLFARSPALIANGVHSLA